MAGCEALVRRSEAACSVLTRVQPRCGPRTMQRGVHTPQGNIRTSQVVSCDLKCRRRAGADCCASARGIPSAFPCGFRKYFHVYQPSRQASSKARLLHEWHRLSPLCTYRACCSAAKRQRISVPIPHVKGVRRVIAVFRQTNSPKPDTRSTSNMASSWSFVITVICFRPGKPNIIRVQAVDTCLRSGPVTLTWLSIWDTVYCPCICQLHACLGRKIIASQDRCLMYNIMPTHIVELPTRTQH